MSTPCILQQYTANVEQRQILYRGLPCTFYMSSEAQKITFSSSSSQNSNVATIFSLSSWPHGTHDGSNNVNCHHRYYNKRLRGVAMASSYACNHCQGYFGAALSRVRGRSWCTHKKAMSIHLMESCPSMGCCPRVLGPPSMVQWSHVQKSLPSIKVDCWGASKCLCNGWPILLAVHQLHR